MKKGYKKALKKIINDLEEIATYNNILIKWIDDNEKKIYYTASKKGKKHAFIKSIYTDKTSNYYFLDRNNKIYLNEIFHI